MAKNSGLLRCGFHFDFFRPPAIDEFPLHPISKVGGDYISQILDKV